MDSHHRSPRTPPPDDRSAPPGDKICDRWTHSADLASIPRETYRQLLRTGKIPVVRVGRSVYVMRDDLLAFLAARREVRTEVQQVRQPRGRRGRFSAADDEAAS